MRGFDGDFFVASEAVSMVGHGRYILRGTYFLGIYFFPARNSSLFRRGREPPIYSRDDIRIQGF